MDDTIKKQLTEAGVDLDKTMERFMNNEALYLKFLKRFPEDPNYAQLKEHISTGDYEEAFRDAHTLKGVAGNLGLESLLYGCAPALTEELRSRKYDRLDEFVQDAEENYELLTQIIRQLSVDAGHRRKGKSREG